jgi:hypothetical protein
MSSIAVTDQNIELKDQLRDYQFRGEGLAAMNLYDFLVDTHENVWAGEDMETDNVSQKKAGRPRKSRFPYLPGAEKPTKCRMQRDAGHEYLPRFIGKWFPRNNDLNGNNELHDASILLFMKPWRNLHDLKRTDEPFQTTFARFLEMATEKQLTMIENIQYYHDCWDVAQKRRDALRAGQAFKLFDYEKECMPRMENEGVMFADDLEDIDFEPTYLPVPNVTEEQIQRARLEQRRACDRVFATDAMELANAANVFGNEYQTTVRSFPACFLRRASNDDMKIFDAWEIILKELTRKQFEEDGETNLSRLHLYPNAKSLKPTLQLEHDSEDSSQGATSGKTGDQGSETTSDRPKLAMLNADQRKAHDMIEQHIFDGEYLKKPKRFTGLITNQTTRKTSSC